MLKLFNFPIVFIQFIVAWQYCQLIFFCGTLRLGIHIFPLLDIGWRDQYWRHRYGQKGCRWSCVGSVNLLPSSYFLPSYLPSKWAYPELFSHLLVLMWSSFIYHFNTSTYRYLGKGWPAGIFQSGSSPYSMSCGNKPCGIWYTRPSQIRRLLLITMRMSWHPALCNASAFEILSCHFIPRIRLKHLRWKVFNFFSCQEYVAHVSLP